MSENKKVFFIINKFAGTGYQDSLEGRIITECGSQNIDCTIEFTRERGHATELAQQAVRQRFDKVFAVGGDGTINEVAKGLVHTYVPMGILPKGSGNGLARHLGISLELKKAVKLLASPNTIDMDTILVNDHLSLNVSGIGFDGHIAWLFGKNGRRGLIGYATLVLKEFLSFKEVAAEITIDGQTMRDNNFIIALANSSQFGNNAKIAPYASVCDQEIDICLVKKVPFTSAIGFAKQMFSGKLDQSKFVNIRRGKQLKLVFDHPVAYHVDGESHAPEREFNVSMQPGTLRMIVPDIGLNRY
jgi:YegS/Rv2252/BmrU family lipid kinase